MVFRNNSYQSPCKLEKQEIPELCKIFLQTTERLQTILMNDSI